MSYLLSVSRAALMALILAPTLLLSDQAFAAEPSAGYVGADIGLHSNYGTRDLNSRIYGGYHLGRTEAFGKENDHAVELALFTLGSRYDDWRYISSGAPVYSKAKASGMAVTSASSLHLSERWTLDSRVGVSYTHSRAYYADDGQATQTWNSVNLVAGVGLSYRLDRHWAATLDYAYTPYQVFRDTRVSNTMLSAGLAYHF
ncbi:MAG: outer membrane beta-barrel protein [Sphingomonadaceae bacterium]